MRRAFFRKTVIQQHHQRKALLPHGPGNRLLSLADGCGIGNRPVVGRRYHFFQPFPYLFLRGIARHLDELPVGPFQQEVVAQRRKQQPADSRLPVQAKQIRVLPALPRPFCVSLHIFYHRMQLPLMCQHPVKRRTVIYVVHETYLPRFCLTALHISSQHLLDASRHRLLHLKHDVVVVGHHLVGQYLYLRARLQHLPLLIDDSPSYLRLLNDSLSSVMCQRAKQRLPVLCHHRDMHDARLPPCAGL